MPLLGFSSAFSELCGWLVLNDMLENVKLRAGAFGHFVSLSDKGMQPISILVFAFVFFIIVLSFEG